MNIEATETLVIEPTISMAMLGGTVSPMIAAAASTAAPSGAPCRSRMRSRITVPTAATSAGFEPERPDTMYMLNTVTCSKPPRMWPTSVSMNRTRRVLIPPRSMISPARMKNGTASRMKLPVPLTIVCGRTTRDAAPDARRYVAVARSSTNPTGTPTRMPMKKKASADQRVECQQRRADRQRHCDQSRRQLQDWRAFAPTRGDEFEGGYRDQRGSEHDQRVGESETESSRAVGKKILNDPHMRVIAGPIGNRAADKTQDRQSQSRNFVGPEEGAVQIGSRDNVGDDQRQFADERHHDRRIGERVYDTQDQCSRTHNPRSHVEERVRRNGARSVCRDRRFLCAGAIHECPRDRAARASPLL